MTRKPKSKREVVVSFTVACVGVAASTMELHGSHRVIMFAIDAAIILVAAIFIRRRVLQMKTDNPQTLAE
jgi:Na+/pantothenate symporter